MVLYSVVLYTDSGGTAGLTIGMAIIAYVLAIYIYAMTARLAFNGRTRLLIGSGALGIIAAVMASGVSGTWLVVLGWLVLLISGWISGRLTRRGVAPHRVYVAAALVVAVMTLVQHLPIFSELIIAARENFERIMMDARGTYESMGLTETMIEQNLQALNVVADLVVRLLPGLTILGTLAQFSVGYLVFAGWISRSATTRVAARPFVMWRVPFFVAGALVAFIVLRLVGGDSMARVADNGLVILSVYYSVCGLALMEFFMRRLKVSCLLKGGIYVLLFFTQIIGYVAAVLLGFIDSYKDWRSQALAADASA